MKLFSFCLIYLSVYLAIGQTTTIKVNNPDTRKYTLVGEKMVLYASLSPTKGHYIIRALVNGKQVYKLNSRQPKTQFEFYPTTSKVGKHAVILEVTYMAMGSMKNLKHSYTYEVKAPNKNLFRRFFINYPNEIPVYHDARGRPIKVQFKGDTSQVKIYQGVRKIYVVPSQSKAQVLAVYYKGRKIDQIKFQAMQLPAPRIQLLHAKDSTKCRRDCSSEVLVNLNELSLAFYLLSGASRKLLIKEIEITHQNSKPRSIYGGSSLRIHNNRYILTNVTGKSIKSETFTEQNGNRVKIKEQMMPACQSGDLVTVKATKASQLFTFQPLRSKKKKIIEIPLSNIDWLQYRVK
ncbi:hypothetical protein BKI52_16270 [marine bacterium AO1-C]|nr:hypothetical protein BKI52_16270 [marine bacterium AO1-C]